LFFGITGHPLKGLVGVNDLGSLHHQDSLTDIPDRLQQHIVQKGFQPMWNVQTATFFFI
jgi:hypothetical protein